MKHEIGKKGFILSTEMVLGIIAAILVISAVSMLATNPGNQPDSKITSQITTIFNTQTKLLRGTLETIGPPPEPNKDYYCYLLHWEGIEYNNQDGTPQEKTNCEETP